MQIKDNCMKIKMNIPSFVCFLVGIVFLILPILLNRSFLFGIVMACWAWMLSYCIMKLSDRIALFAFSIAFFVKRMRLDFV